MPGQAQLNEAFRTVLIECIFQNLSNVLFKLGSGVSPIAVYLKIDQLWIRKNGKLKSILVIMSRIDTFFILLFSHQLGNSAGQMKLWINKLIMNFKSVHSNSMKSNFVFWSLVIIFYNANAHVLHRKEICDQKISYSEHGT